MRDKVFFLSRAYNDIDCRLPLLLEFAKDKRYTVHVIGIPSSNGLHDPRKHELTSLLRQNGVSISTIYERAVDNPLLRAVYALYVSLDALLWGPLSGEAGERMKRWFFKIVLWLSVRQTEWIRKILEDFRSSIVMLDEIAFQNGRSFFVDELIRNKVSGDYSIYSFSTGQDPYLNLWFDKKTADATPRKDRVGIPLYVPGPNDKDVMQKSMPQEQIEVVGNTRFDLLWVETLAGFASKNIEHIELLKRPVDHKIVFMLSKIEYGVDLENIIKAMNLCAALPDSLVIVKPHTRGMSIDALGAGLDKRVVNGAHLSSSELIEWSDTVLFTGSSIAFQAMQLGRKVIFLKCCQQYKSIYENSGAMLVALSVEDVVGFVDMRDRTPVSSEALDVFLTEHIYNGLRSGRVCESIKEKIEQREFSHAS